MRSKFQLEMRKTFPYFTTTTTILRAGDVFLSLTEQNKNSRREDNVETIKLTEIL